MGNPLGIILGFSLSAVVQAAVSKEEMSRLLPDDSAGTIVKACGLGAASSSCSYAAVALARSMFRKGANFTAAMAFQFASTNLVLELGILLAVLLGWQFTLAEFTGGPLMIAIMVVLFKAFLTPKIVEVARQQADKGLQGRMEGDAAKDIRRNKQRQRGRVSHVHLVRVLRRAFAGSFFLAFFFAKAASTTEHAARSIRDQSSSELSESPL